MGIAAVIRLRLTELAIEQRQLATASDCDFRTIPTFFARMPQTPLAPCRTFSLIPMLWHAPYIECLGVGRWGLPSVVRTRRMSAAAYGKERA